MHYDYIHIILLAILSELLISCSNSVDADNQINSSEFKSIAISKADSIFSDEGADSSESLLTYSDKVTSSSTKETSSSAKDSSSSANSKVSSSNANNSCSSNLFIDDNEYPYTGIPRIVIETENLQKVADREIEIPAKLQIWGEKEPESEIWDLTIRGRGNSTWKYPQKTTK